MYREWYSNIKIRLCTRLATSSGGRLASLSLVLPCSSTMVTSPSLLGIFSCTQRWHTGSPADDDLHFARRRLVAARYEADCGGGNRNDQAKPDSQIRSLSQTKETPCVTLGLSEMLHQ